MRRTGTLFRRFLASTRGLAAIEFAYLMPVLMVLLLATIDAGRALAAYMKVRSATYALDSITNQYSTIHDTDMTQILGATSVILMPFTGAPVVVISQLKVASSGGTPTVSWSDTLNGTARAVGSTVSITPPANMCSTYPCYLVFGEVSYTYTPLFNFFIHSSITLSDNLFVTPRSVASITRTTP